MNSKFTHLLLYVIPFFLMLWGYYEFIVPVYGYTGFEWDLNIVKVIEGSIIVVIFSLILPKKLTKPSDIFLHLQFLFPILPMLVLYGARNYSRDFLYITILSFYIIFLIVSKVKLTPISISKISAKAFQKILIALSWLLIFSIIYNEGFRYLNFNFNLVYTFRADAASNLPGIYAYLSPLVSKVLLPFSLLLAVINQEKFFIALSFTGSIMMFGLTSHKGPLFYPFIVLAVYYILKYKKPIRLLLMGYISLILLSLVDFILGFAYGWFASLMLRRTFFTPADISNKYYQLFSEIGSIYWAESKITLGLIEYPHSMPSSMLVGQQMYGFESLNANTGWIGSGYLNAGFTGMIVYAVIIGLLLAMLNAFATLSNKRIVTAIMIGPILTVMMSSDLPTAFLNHGVLLGLVLLAFFIAKKQ